MMESTLVLLKGIGKPIERKLWEHGVFDWPVFLSFSSLPGINPNGHHL
ncbi:MAG: hypothetical protein ACREJU_18070 [Nitrospiraceae bacterium]